MIKQGLKGLDTPSGTLPVRQKGFTLIELMLALVLGLLITGSFLQLMVSNTQSANFNEFLATAQENGRHSLYLLSRELRRAGYRSQPGVESPLPFYLGECNGVATCTFDGGGSSSDQVAIQYEPTTGTDCEGSAVPAKGMTADVYYIAPDPGNNNISTLYCRGYDPVTASPRGSGLALVQGVERLQAVYGLAPGGADNVNQYVSADAVSNWRDVRSMRVGVLVSAGQEGRVFDQRIRTYDVLNSGALSFEDRTPRYAYSTAIKLNNTGL